MVSPDVALYELDPLGLIILPIPFMILATVAISLRAWVRISFARAYGWDDYLLVGAYALYLIQGASSIGIGIVQYTQGVTACAELLGILSFLGNTSYYVGQIFFKLSLAVLFLRIVVDRWSRLIIIGSVSLFALYSILAFLVIIFQCGDPEKTMALTTGGLERQTKCLSFPNVVGPILYALATYNAFVDWIFALLPIMVIRKLQMKPEDKRSVIFMILLACSCSIVSIIRIPIMKDMKLTENFYGTQQNAIAYISMIECGFGIVVASAATYRPLLRLSQARIRHFIALYRHDTKVEPEHSMADLAKQNAFATEGVSYKPACSSGQGLSYEESWDVATIPENIGWRRDLIIPECEWDEGDTGEAPVRKRSVGVLLDGIQV